ncbi:hypothetical protein QCD79_34740, partial [Pseudomonas quasicaspiana]|nr:hypothetical protein [Pseudomonas quasicaspiana]
VLIDAALHDLWWHSQGIAVYGCLDFYRDQLTWPQQLLWPGQLVTVKIQTAIDRDALRVPPQVVQRGIDQH